jgi:hypothetical protein
MNQIYLDIFLVHRFTQIYVLKLKHLIFKTEGEQALGWSGRHPRMAPFVAREPAMGFMPGCPHRGGEGKAGRNQRRRRRFWKREVEDGGRRLGRVRRVFIQTRYGPTKDPQPKGTTIS